MRELVQRIVNAALGFGADEADAVAVEREGVEANAFAGEIDAFVRSLSCGIGVRAIVGGRVGYAYTEKMDEAEGVAKAAVENARISDPQPGAGIYAGQGRSGCEKRQPLDDARDITAATLALYEAAMREGADSVATCAAESTTSTVYFANSAGVACEDCRKFSILFVEPVAKKDDYTDSNHDFAVGPDIAALDVDAVAKKAFMRAMQYYGAQRVKAGAVPVVISAEAMADLLGAFVPMFSAENAQKGLSLLKGKEGARIAPDHITLIDNPDHPKLPFGYAFDGEGAPTAKKNVVDRGMLTSLLYDVASANRAGKATTANARRSYNTQVSIAPYHFYFLPGEATVEALVASAGEGILVAEVSGLHAGVNATSGDFSLLAKGFAIRDGKKAAPIAQMVVSGNFLSLLDGVRGIADDLTFGIPGGSCFGSPTMLVDGLTVAAD
jgi:PmbA protein